MSLSTPDTGELFETSPWLLYWYVFCSIVLFFFQKQLFGIIFYFGEPSLQLIIAASQQHFLWCVFCISLLSSFFLLHASLMETVLIPEVHTWAAQSRPPHPLQVTPLCWIFPLWISVFLMITRVCICVKT